MILALAPAAFQKDLWQLATFCDCYLFLCLDWMACAGCTGLYSALLRFVCFSIDRFLLAEERGIPLLLKTYEYLCGQALLLPLFAELGAG